MTLVSCLLHTIPNSFYEGTRNIPDRPSVIRTLISARYAYLATHVNARKFNHVNKVEVR